MLNAPSVPRPGFPRSGIPRPDPARAAAGLLRLAWRDLRGGFSDFIVFIACVALGVFVITAVSGLADALTLGLARQGASILGGDVTLARSHTPASAETRRWLEARGRLSETATMRTMARRVDDTDSTLAELKGVDAAYPLKGAVKLSDGRPLGDVLGEAHAAAVEPILLERLGLKVGDTLAVGRATLTIRAVIGAEPDGLLDRVAFGARILVSLATLRETDLIQPGALVRWRYALALPDGGDNGGGDDNTGAVDATLEAARSALTDGLAGQGFTVLDRRDPSPQLRKTIERLRQFLTLIGLTSLIVGGVGIANAVTAFVDKRRVAIAILKSLGAPAAFIERLYLTEILAMAAIGVAVGLALGVAVPAVVASLWGASLPIAPVWKLSGHTVFAGAAYGFLVTLLFAILPLGRARAVSPAVLFRDSVAPVRLAPSKRSSVALAAIALSLVAVTVFGSEAHWLALQFCAGLGLTFLVFAGLGRLIVMAARRMPRPRRPEFGLALGSLGAPGGLTQTIVLSLGIGLSLLVAVALVNAGLVQELTGRLPAKTPNYFVLDVGRADIAGLTARIGELAPGSTVEKVPMLRGRISALNGVPVEHIKVSSEADWVLSGERGLTYSDELPKGSRLIEGRWWTPAEAAQGEPLVSFDAELARRLSLKIGDTVTVNVLGRDVTARVHNLREVNWESFAINFVMVFSNPTLIGAPHNLLVTITLPQDASLKDEAAIARAVAAKYPTVTMVRVKDAIAGAASVFAKIMLAVKVAGSVTLLAGALVLAGGLATAERTRAGEAVILKTLGATRARIIGAHMAEYAALALMSGAVAVVVGGLCAWFALAFVMHVPFDFAWTEVLAALGLALVMVFALGAVSTWRVLSVRPAPYLRGA